MVNTPDKTNTRYTNVIYLYFGHGQMFVVVSGGDMFSVIQPANCRFFFLNWNQTAERLHRFSILTGNFQVSNRPITAVLTDCSIKQAV